ncbi:MAG: hypothetical protein IJ375_01125 [Oscillospiraceae bacterium]|nr:hypothetical protein [Oscillospiraceae bacterium]
MKSRTSFFNPTVFKKDLTRFAPVWILYTLFLLLVLLGLLDVGMDYARTQNVVTFIQIMAGVNLCYAALNVQLLFGDLYNARLCNALHALPLRRECWFCTHTAAGLLMALAPCLVFVLVALCMLGAGWSAALWWLLAVMLQYLFFFGTGVFSVMLTGNRFAQILVYGLINFLSLLAYWFAGTLYEPLMYGVTLRPDWFEIFCPMYAMAENSDYLYVARVQENVPYYSSVIREVTPVPTSWGYLLICAAIGIALGAAALALYRKRDLESAGDFIAFRAVEPVFLALFTLVVGAFLQLCARLFDSSLEYVFLAVGIVVGYFVGRMLLMRTTRVFQLKSLLGLGGIAAALILSLILVKLDAFGIVRYVPKTEDIQSVSFYSTYYRNNGGNLDVTDPEDIENIRSIHSYAVSDEAERLDEYMTYSNGVYFTYLSINYELTDGSYLQRRYSIPVDSEAGRTLAEYYSTVEYLLGVSEEELEDVADRIISLYVDSEYVSKDRYPELYEDDRFGELLRALAADCKTGSLIQDWGYHHGDEDPSHVYLELQWAVPTVPGETTDQEVWIAFYVYDSCVNTLAWLEANGFEINENAMYGG